MSFSAQASAQTINQNFDLQVTDTAVYGTALNSISKTNFIGRTVKLIRFDGISEIISFPFTNTPDNFQDSLIIPGYFNNSVNTSAPLDLIVSITISYIYQLNNVNTSTSYVFVYQSVNTINNVLANYAIFLAELPVTDPLYNKISEAIKSMIIYVAASKAKIAVNDLITAQKLLTLAYNYCLTREYEC